MKHENTKSLFEYWNKLRGDRLLPNRDEIQPSGLRNVLGDTFILQDEPRFEASFRLCGSNVNQIFCRELKGQRFLSLFPQEGRVPMQTLWRAVAEDRAAVLFGSVGTTASGKELHLETLLLPLGVSPTQGYRVLGTTSSFEHPYWLGVEAVKHQTIASVRIVMPDDLTRLGEETPGLASPEAPVAALRLAGKSARRYGHLVVVDGGNQSHPQ
ncbi:MAG: PAS domain-containing protein [Pseudomonadota bacterium]